MPDMVGATQRLTNRAAGVSAILHQNCQKRPGQPISNRSSRGERSPIQPHDDLSPSPVPSPPHCESRKHAQKKHLCSAFPRHAKRPQPLSFGLKQHVKIRVPRSSKSRLRLRIDTRLQEKKRAIRNTGSRLAGYPDPDSPGSTTLADGPMHSG